MTIPRSVYSTAAALCEGNGGNENGNRPPLLISGKVLFFCTNRGASQRAGLAAQLVLDEARATKLSVAQAGVLTLATIPSIYEALHLAPAARAQVATGELSLADATKANGLLTAWIAATPAQKRALGIARGVTEIWDQAIQPLI